MKKKNILIVTIFTMTSLLLCACGGSSETSTPAVDTPSLTYIGHSSIKIKTKDNKVIYVDPAASGNYKEAADIILVTHNHDDHNKVSLVTTKDNTKTILSTDSLKDGVYEKFDVDGIKIQAVPAYNKNHDKAYCVGYVIEFDGIKLYHAGDTDNIPEMKELSSQGITYALLPIDGTYNMGPGEAKEAATIINAKHTIPIHTAELTAPYNETNAKAVGVSSLLIVKPEETIHLES